MKKDIPSRKSHWTYTLFVKHPELFLPSLELRNERTSVEVDSLCKIFNEFGLSKRAKILDLMCGIGRHSVRLARRGYEVVGFDLSRFYLNRAERWAKRERLSRWRLRLYEGDSREAVNLLSDQNETGFEAIINMYTSHGYFGDEEDLRLFNELRKISTRKCLLIIETANRDFLVKHFEQFGFWDMSPKLEWHEKRKLNLETSWMENTWKFYRKLRRKGLKLALELPVNLRVYSLHELKKTLDEAGWKLLKSYGNFQLDPLTYDSRHMILVSRRS